MLTSQLITFVALVTLLSRSTADEATRLDGDDRSDDFGGVMTSHKQIQSISEGSDCKCRCIVRPQVVGPCPGRPGLDRVEFSIDTISGGSDCRCRCVAPTPQHHCQIKESNEFDQQETASVNQQRSPSNVVDLQKLLDRAITGVDVRKIHSGVTKMVLAMIDLEQALKVNITEHGATMRQNMNQVVTKMENTSNYIDSLDIIKSQMIEEEQLNVTESSQKNQTTVPTVASSNPTAANPGYDDINLMNQPSEGNISQETRNTNVPENATSASQDVPEVKLSNHVIQNEEYVHNESDINSGHKMASKPTYLNVTSPSVTSSPLLETNNVTSTILTGPTSSVTFHDVIKTSHDVTLVKSTAAPPRGGKFVPYRDDFDIDHQGGARELEFHYDDNNEVIVHPPLVGGSDEFDIAKQSSTAEERSSTTQSSSNVSFTTNFKTRQTSPNEATQTTRMPLQSSSKPTQPTLTTQSVTDVQSPISNTTVGRSISPTTQSTGGTTTVVASQPTTMASATSQSERSMTSSDPRSTAPSVGESSTSVNEKLTTIVQSSTTVGQSSTTVGQSSTTRGQSSTTASQSSLPSSESPTHVNGGQSGAGNSHTDYYSPFDDVDDDDFYDDYLDESTTTSTTTEATTLVESAPCGTLFNLSKPQLIHDFGRREGSWMRDPLARGRQRGKIYVTNFYYGNNLIEFDNMRAFKHFRMSHSHMLPYSWIGTGHIVYNGSFYYNRAFSKNIIKYNLKKRFVSAWGHLRNAVYDPTTPFTWRGHTMVHMTADESGLWVIYAAHSDTGAYPNAQVYVVNKINPIDLQTIQSWKTPIRRRGASHLFLVCGIVYVTDRFEARRARITHAYDTHTGVGRYLFVPFLQSYAYNVQMLYNPKEKRVYSWDKGHQIIYDVNFSY